MGEARGGDAKARERERKHLKDTLRICDVSAMGL